MAITMPTNYMSMLMFMMFFLAVSGLPDSKMGSI
jgi:hypothetical protein